MKTQKPNNIFLLSIGLVGLLVLVARLAYTPFDQTSASEGNPLIQDASVYADDQGVPLDEAVRRFKIQNVAGELIAELTQFDPETFAGAWIQHKPEFRIVVQFTNDGEKTIELYLSKEKYAALTDLVELRTAKVTLQELEKTQLTIGLTARKLGIPFEANINVFKNQVVFYIPDPVSFQKSLEAAGVTFPDYVLLVAVAQ